VLDIKPKIAKTEGSTVLSVIGYGFANTGDLLCKFGTESDPLSCNGKECVFPAKFVSDTEVQCTTPKAS
jgi:hypothetical protein